MRSPSPRKGPLRIAHFSPLPPARSGIADNSLELLPYLAERVETTIFAERPDEVSDSVKSRFNIHSMADFEAQRGSFDLALYHVGNSTHNQLVYEMAIHHPGVVVLHDHGLHHLIAAMTGSDERFNAYIRELGYVQGIAGIDLAWRIRYGQEPYPWFEIPLNNRLIDRSLGLIVHSQAVAEMIHAHYPLRPLQVVHQQMSIWPQRSFRQKMNLADDTVVFACIGQITAAKRIDMALRAFADLLPSYPNSAFLIIGEIVGDIDLKSTIEDLGLGDKVQYPGYAPDLQSFLDWAATADVVINLRYPTVGETSGSALRAMTAGRPLIVFDHGSYSELPDSACLKIQPMDEEALLSAMLLLAGEPDRRREMGREGAAYIQKHHNPDHIAGQYVAFFQKILADIDGRFGGRS